MLVIVSKPQRNMMKMLNSLIILNLFINLRFEKECIQKPLYGKRPAFELNSQHPPMNRHVRGMTALNTQNTAALSTHQKIKFKNRISWFIWMPYHLIDIHNIHRWKWRIKRRIIHITSVVVEQTYQQCRNHIEWNCNFYQS